MVATPKRFRNGIDTQAPSTASDTWAFKSQVAYDNVLTPSGLTGNTNDYSPTDLATSSVLRLSSTGSFNLTGLTGGSVGRIIKLINAGSNNITLTNEDAGSTAGNRFKIIHDIVLEPDQAITLIYDATNTRWRTDSSDDGRLKVSSDDTTPEYLLDKVAGTTNKITVTETGGGGDESLTVNIGSDVFDKAVDDSDDVTEGSTNKFMTADQETYLSTVVGTAWASGLVVSISAGAGVDDIDVSSGTFYVDSVLYTHAGTTDFSFTADFTALGSGERQIAEVYIDNTNTIKRVLGTAVSGNAKAEPPAHPTNTVCLAYVKLDKNTGTVVADDITDCRVELGQGVFDTDELTKISSNDTTSKYLIDALSNNGNITFTEENDGSNESMKADIDSTAISGQGTVTAVSGDFVLISDTSDSGNLKKVDASDFLAGSGDLVSTNNLSDVANATTSFDNIAPTTTKGDVIVHNGTDNIRVAVGTDGQFLKADSGQASGVIWAGASADASATEVSGAGDVTTTSTTFVVATGMTLTPGAGNYLVLFSSVTKNSNANNQNTFAIFDNGTEVTNSSRMLDLKTANSMTDINLQAVVTGLGAGESIDVRWKVDANTGTLGNRSLAVIKIA